MNVVTNAGKVIEMSSSRSTKTPQDKMSKDEEILAEIIKRINPEKIILASVSENRTFLQIVKDSITITVNKEQSKSYAIFNGNGLELTIQDLSISPDVIDFWFYRFRDLLASRRILEV